MTTACRTCGGEGWVCENHPEQHWNYGAGHIWRDSKGKVRRCDGAGMPCKCNTSNPPWKHREVLSGNPKGYEGELE